jgi:DNA-binding CsgD family transcriptional regulator
MATVDRTHLAPSVARELGITRYTVKSTLANLSARLGLHTRAEIVVEMMRRGLVR